MVILSGRCSSVPAFVSIVRIAKSVLRELLGLSLNI